MQPGASPQWRTTKGPHPHRLAKTLSIAIIQVYDSESWPSAGAQPLEECLSEGGAMPEPSFWTRMKEARIIPVLLAYLVACWGILLLVDLLQDRFGLPDWMDPVAIVLLLVGLLMVTATAWKLSHPLSRTQRSEGKVPGDWEVAPGALLGDLVVGRAPHLTWGRSLLGGIFALGLMFALAAIMALLAGLARVDEAEDPHPPTQETPAATEAPRPQE